ncbi:hypothetical protein BH23THE1_BH23THE1_25150 [soil metagenome]
MLLGDFNHVYDLNGLDGKIFLSLSKKNYSGSPVSQLIGYDVPLSSSSTPQ